jgi:hypothetical protein
VSKRSTWVAWSLLGAYMAGIGATVVLAVAKGPRQNYAAVVCVLGPVMV